MDAADSLTRFEYRSRLKIGRLPLVHVVRGVDPATGRRPTAVGVIAIGQVAIGVVAIGQLAIGAISVGQASVGLGWGIGQAAVGLLAVGQIAAGGLGAVGQVALGPAGFGVVRDPGAWVAIGWLGAAVYLSVALGRRRHRLAPALGKPRPSSIRSLTGADDRGPAAERGHVVAHVVSADRLRGPLSGRPCAFWHAVDVGPTGPAEIHSGGDVAIADATGLARIDFDAPVVLLGGHRAQAKRQPDGSVRFETALGEGDEIHVAGPIVLASDPDAGGSSRGGVSPVFSGRADQPVVISTRNLLVVRAELRFAAALACAFVLAGLACGVSAFF